MDDAAEAPLSQFSGIDWRARLQQVLGELAGSASLTLLEKLEEQAERAGAEAELGRAYAALIGDASWEQLPKPLRLEALLKAAWACAQLDDADGVTLRAATFALELQPADERALAIAEPLWLEAEQYSELANRYAVAATSAGSEARARQLLERAIHMLGELPAAMPAVMGLHERMARLHELRDTDAALLSLVQSGGAAATGALVKLGERWLNQGRARDGVAQLPSDLSEFSSEPALDVLERLFDQAEELGRLGQLLERRVALEASPLGQARALEKLANFRQDLRRDLAAAARAFYDAAEAYSAAGERDDAERAYQRLLDLSPDHVAAASRLVSLRATAGDFAGAGEAFGVVLRASDDNQRAAELLLSVARDAERVAAAEEFAELVDNVLWRLSGDDHEISERLLRESAELYAAQARDDEAAELYRRLIADRATTRDLDAYQTLIDEHSGSEWRRNQQRWLFEWQEHHSSDRPTVLLSWAHFEERELGDPRAALNVLERAAALAPDRAEIWDNLLRLRLSTGDGRGGVSAAGELRRLGRDVDASLLGLLLEQEPTTRFAFDRLKVTLSAEQRWPELFEMYDRAIAAATDLGERARFLDEAAIAARDVAQDRLRAARYWEAHAELKPNEARVDLALERLYEQTGDRAALIRHLRRRLEHASDEQCIELERRLSLLLLDAGALDDALAAIERLSAAGQDTDALLERLFEQSRQPTAPTEARASGRRAAERLRARYAEQSRPLDSARVLRAELGLGLETAERRELLMALSRLCERELDDLPAAFETERQLFDLTHAERERKRLEKLCKKLGRWAELSNIYADAADSELSVDERRSHLRRSAEIALAELGDVALATRRYKSWLELEPERAVELLESLQSDRGPTPVAFEALCQLLAETRRFAELESLLLRACESTPSPALYSRLGRLRADELADPGGAIAAHLAASDARAAGEVFLRQPSVYRDEAGPVLELAERLGQCGLPEGAVRVLRHQLAHYAARYTPERKRVLLALLDTLRELGEHEAASLELAEAAKHFLTDADVQHACALDALSRHDFDKAEQCYRALLLLLHGKSEGPGGLRRSAVYAELAAIKRRRGDPAASRELVDSGFEVALGDGQELAALVQRLTAHEQWDAAESASAALLELGQDLPSAAIALTAIRELMGRARPLAPELLAKAQRIARDTAGRYRELSEPTERSSLLAACVSLLPLAEARRLLSEAEPELVSADALGARLALASRLLDAPNEAERADAISELQALTRHADAPASAWQLLARARETSGDAPALREVLENWLEREPSNAVVLGRALAAAIATDDCERALSLYDRYLQLGATPTAELSSSLCALCLQKGQTERAVELLRAEAERETKPAKRAPLLLQAAELLLAAGDAAAARGAAQEARNLDPSCADAVWLLAQLSLRARQRDEALALLSAHLESNERRRSKPLSRVLRLAADLQLERDQLAEALPLLVEAHQLDKTDLDTALLLGLLAIDLDRLETAASALRVLIAQRELGTREGAAARSLSLAEGYFQLARIEQHHGKKTNAKRMALRALEENPAFERARTLVNELNLH